MFKNTNKKIKFRYILLFLIVIAMVYVIWNAVSIYNFGKIDEKQDANVAIILGAATDGKKVSPVFRERINHGIWLYDNGYVSKVIMTGGYGKGNKKSDAAIAKQYAVNQKIPEDDILIEEKSKITDDNLKNAKAIMDDNSYDEAIIVSDPMHMKRSMLLAKDAGIKEAYSSPTPTTRYKSFWNKAGFLGREVFFYICYLGYRIR